MKKKYDVIIVGAGPAGIFSALELLNQKEDARILIIEKGHDIDKRICPMAIREISCATCPECALLSGWGGAGAFSDGKLNLSPKIGGFLSRYIGSERGRFRPLSLWTELQGTFVLVASALCLRTRCVVCCWFEIVD